MIFIRIHKCGDHLLLSMIVLLTDPLLLELTVEDLCTKLKVAEEKLRKMEGVEERLQIVEKKLERLTAMMESNQRCQYSPEDSSSLYDTQEEKLNFLILNFHRTAEGQKPLQYTSYVLQHS